VYTVGHARDTSWAILTAVLEVLLVDSYLLRTVVAQLKIWLVEQTPWNISADDATALLVNQIMEMLTGAAEDGASLSDYGHDVAAFEACCGVVQNELKKLVKAQTKKSAQSRMLHPARPLNLRQSDFAIRGMILKVPIQTAPNHSADSIQQRRQLAAKNIAWLPSPLKSTASWMDADKWLENPRLQPGQSSCASKLVCTNVEIMVYTKICNGSLDSKAKLTAKEVQSLESVIDRYRQVVDQRYDALTEEESRVKLQSRELLVVWSMFCIMHKTTNLEYSAILDAYSVALEMADLQHLVLFSKLAVDAALTVVKYLRARSLKGLPIF